MAALNVERYAARFSPRLRKAFLAAVEAAKGTIPLGVLADAVGRGMPAVLAVLADAKVPRGQFDAVVDAMVALMVAPTVVGRAVASHAKVHNPPLAAPPTRRYGQNAPRVKTGPHVLLKMRIPTPTWKPHHQWWSPLRACPSRRKSSAKDATHAMVVVMSVVHARKPNPLRA